MPLIYKLTSPSNKVYIGQSWNWTKRKSVYKRNACPYQRHLQNSLTKYGFEKHTIEILCILPDDVEQSLLDLYEVFYLDICKDFNIKLLNIRDGGRGGKLSDETRLKMSNSLKGRVCLEESKRKQSISSIGRKVSSETVAKIKATRLLNGGYIVTEEQKEKLRIANLGKTVSLDTRNKISKSSIGHPTSEETKIKIGNGNRGSNNGMFGKIGELNPQSKKVIDLSTDVIFSCVREAADYYKINKASLTNKLNGRTKNNTTLKYLIDVCS